MGCHPSKLKRPSERLSKYDIDGQEKNDTEIFGEDSSDSAILKKHDQETLSVIRKDLKEKPELFVLNNVLMCTMFMKNYQKEMKEIINQIHNPQERFIEPDIVMEKANENVTYRPLHGPKKSAAEALVSKRIYVPMNDLIEVYNTLDDKNESSCGNKYEVAMEESKHKGFMKLKRLGEYSNDRNSLKDSLTVPSSSTSVSSDTDSSGSPKANPQLIKDQTDECTLQDCFVFRKVKKADIDVIIEDLDHENLTDDDVYDIVSYLPSRTFMKYFQSKIFKNYIAKELGLVQDEIDFATVDENIPGRIFCNVLNKDGNCHTVEILPCLNISWPESQTYDFLFRKPPDINTHYLFPWPTQEMLNQIRLLNCTLVPRRYSVKRGEYPEGDLEWEIHFPLAERYLQTFLRPEQIKCYLVLLTLYKEYIEPITRKQGLAPEHLRTLILWESENDYDGWPEHRLGIRLMSILENLSIALRRRHLPDYFIGKKNVLQKVSRKCLEHANEVTHRIIQSPAMLIIRALRNLRTTSGTFYPPLNFKELLSILYRRDWSSASPYLDIISYDDDAISTSSSEKKPKFTDAEKQLQYVKERKRKRRLMKQREKTNNTNGRRLSRDSVNDDWECEKPFAAEKKIAILKFFINNYLEIAKTSSRIGTEKQTMFYLKQAWYLTKILQEENRLFEEEVKDFFIRIKQEEEKYSLDKINNNVKGNVPQDKFNRDSLNKMVNIFNTISSRNEFIQKDSAHQQVGQTNINLKSLSRSFSHNYPVSNNYGIKDFR